MQHTSLESIGEFGLIEYLTKNLRMRHSSTLKGPGDDCAVLRYPADIDLLWSADMLIEGTHFDLSYVPLKHLGYKSVVVNLSDVFAMGGKPQQISVSIAISSRFSLEAIDELYQGIYLACERYGIDLIGGDTCSAPSGMVISLSVIGSVEKDKAVYRSGAKANDLIAVTGDLGAAYLGLQILQREKEVFLSTGSAALDLEPYHYLLERQLKPESPVEVILALQEAGLRPNAMIDISDGLSSEALHLCKASGVGCTLFENKLPIDPLSISVARDLNLDPTTCALNGGEDYELLMTFPIDSYKELKSIAGISIIGHISANEGVCELVTDSGAIVPLQAQGWRAFEEEPRASQAKEDSKPG